VSFLQVGQERLASPLVRQLIDGGHHVTATTASTVAALTHGSPGIYNIVDDEPAKVSDWMPYMTQAIGAKPPLRVPAWLGRLLAGEVAVQWMTEGRGASNAKAKRELGLQLAWPTWREEFRRGLSLSKQT
jgi:2-alkyl-3-oxoalkanoate reductase